MRGYRRVPSRGQPHTKLHAKFRRPCRFGRPSSLDPGDTTLADRFIARFFFLGGGVSARGVVCTTPPTTKGAGLEPEPAERGLLWLLWSWLAAAWRAVEAGGARCGATHRRSDAGLPLLQPRAAPLS